jgi:hypothetical protein
MKFDKSLLPVFRQEPDGTVSFIDEFGATLRKAKDTKSGRTFPLTIKTHRIAPGNKNNWYLEIWGTKACARWTSSEINTLWTLEYKGGQQAWQRIEMSHDVAYKSITGGIFQMGFSDSILQMWAAFCYELVHRKTSKKFAGCVTPGETTLSHSLFTAALASYATGQAVLI